MGSVGFGAVASFIIVVSPSLWRTKSCFVPNIKDRRQGEPYEHAKTCKNYRDAFQENPQPRNCYAHGYEPRWLYGSISHGGSFGVSEDYRNESASNCRVGHKFSPQKKMSTELDLLQSDPVLRSDKVVKLTMLCLRRVPR